METEYTNGNGASLNLFSSSSSSDYESKSMSDKIPRDYNGAIEYEQYVPDGVPNYQKRVSDIRQACNVSKAEAVEMYKAIREFSDGGFAAMRASQMGQYKDDPKMPAQQVAKYAEDCEKYIKKAPKYGGETFRGISLSKSDLEKFTKAYNQKKTIAMDGLSSWTTHRNSAKQWGTPRNGSSKTEGVLFVCKDGQPLGSSIAHIARHKREREVLVSNKARYKIVGYKKENNQHIFEVSAI